MAGGLGRAQGPYDEMVFRSMVLDGTRFPDPRARSERATREWFGAGLELDLMLHDTFTSDALG
jgi:hypothetical protein